MFTHRGQVDSQDDYKAYWLAAGVFIGGSAFVLIATVALQVGVLALPGALAAVLMGCLGVAARGTGCLGCRTLCVKLTYTLSSQEIDHGRDHPTQ